MVNAFSAIKVPTYNSELATPPRCPYIQVGVSGWGFI